ncbi:hypothetical protein EC973_003094 [Apophysomyces ossiformis]|uniref:NmrA-like domain-containing protein n=1 Tax=Apophysomyces ossiformis TaxID=679940 RepID=A0A8H7EMH8_9FUNG|nr:hypothetical protein EC973_003094 [Apophysomyces ossiformis]
MAQQTERIYIIGGTGNVGKETVQDLIANKIPVTLYARNPSKAASLFLNSEDLVTVVQGDYSDLTPLKNSLPGHTRLFLLANAIEDLPKVKLNIATLAYEAGIKQIVDISSKLVSLPWRSTFIGHIHYLAEKAIDEIPGRGAFVTLRPGQFMSNLYMSNPAKAGVIKDVVDKNTPQGWISPSDIGALAAIILRDDIEKHGDAVYDMIGTSVTPAERAAIFSRLLDRPITYQRVSATDRYNELRQATGYPHRAIYDIVSVSESIADVSKGLPILLGREPETLEAFLSANKQRFTVI